ncbi:MAG TPA: YvrJ family protein [Bacillaceae bacterium]
MFDGINFVTLVSNLGFPIVVTIYLLHRFEKKLESLEHSIHLLSDTVTRRRKA